MRKLILFSLLSTFILTACGEPLPEPIPQQMGKTTAPILIEEFADLQCPACGAISPQVEKLVIENPDLARLEFYHFPLAMHEYAFLSAEAAECAGDQNKFWEFATTIFVNQASLNEDYLYSTADSLSLDRTAFDSCMETHKYRSKVKSHMKYGNERGVNATPTLFVNGQMVRWSDETTFKAYLETLK